MATVQIEQTQLVGDYKILSAEAIAQVKDVLMNASEKTIVELPQGLLFLNLTDDDFAGVKPNENVVLKIPSTLIGYFSNDSLYGQQALLPSFLEGTNIATFFESEFYECELPQRKFRISGAARSAQEIWYKSIEDDDVDCAAVDFEDYDGRYSVIELAENADCNSLTLEIENLKLNLYSDDYEAGAFFDIDEKCKITLISGWSYEFETMERALVRVQCKKDARYESDFNEFGFYDPSQINVAGSFPLNVWTLLCNDVCFEWNRGGETQSESFYLYDGEYKDLPFKG